MRCDIRSFLTSVRARGEKEMVAPSAENSEKEQLGPKGLPHRVSTSVKLPVLRLPARIDSSEREKRGARASEDKTGLEARCVSIASSRDVELPIPEDRPWLPPKLEPLTRPENKSPIPSELIGTDDPEVLVFEQDVSEDRQRECLPHLNTLRSMLSQQQYADVYFIVSSLLTGGNNLVSIEPGERGRRLVLLSYRCLCSYGLLRFRECCEDGSAALMLHQQLRSSGGPSHSDAPDDSLHRSVIHAVVSALAMRGLYSSAAELMESLPRVSHTHTESPSKDLFDISLPPLSAMQRTVVSSLESFRCCAEARRWKDAARIIDGCAFADSWVRATPLCAILAIVRLELDDPKGARALLLPYLASLPEPPSGEALSTSPVEYAQLWSDFASHFFFSTTLLAKASFMCGTAYLNISASLLQRVLKLNPFYAPARLFAEFVLSYEAMQQRMTSAVSASNYPTVLSLTAEMLRIPDTKRFVHAELHLVRAQVQWMRRQPLDVVREASRCVQCDPECALAFRLRADALITLDRKAEAAADHATAKRLHARVDAVFDGMRAHRSSYEAALAETYARRQFIPVFAPSPSLSAPSHRLSMEGFLRGTRGTGTRRQKCTDAHPQPSRRTHYSLMGVANDATDAEIRQSYRRLSLQCHPDRLVGAVESDRQAALGAFHVLSHAYSILSDARLRAAYDAELAGLR